MMKTDKEFLNGIYMKADILEREKNQPKVKKSIFSSRSFKFATALAAIVLMIPTYFSLKGNFDHYEELPKLARAIFLEDPMANYYDAEYIVVGRVKRIHKSEYVEEGNYIFTDIDIEVEESLLGSVDEDNIILRASGGQVKSKKLFSKLEGNFNKNKRYVFFLVKYGEDYELLMGEASQYKDTGNNSYIDIYDNTYSLEEIKKLIDGR